MGVVSRNISKAACSSNYFSKFYHERSDRIYFSKVVEKVGDEGAVPQTLANLP